MKSAAVAPAKKVPIRIAVVESDPLRFVGFRALFDSEPDFELISASMPDIATLVNVDLILLGNRNGQNLFDLMASLKATRPDLRIIVTGSGMDEETILKAIASGAKGYLDEAGAAPRSLDVHRASQLRPGAHFPGRPRDVHRSRKASAGDAGRRSF